MGLKSHCLIRFCLCTTGAHDVLNFDVLIVHLSVRNPPVSTIYANKIVTDAILLRGNDRGSEGYFAFAISGYIPLLESPWHAVSGWAMVMLL